MASLTHIRVRSAEKRRAHARRTSGEHVSDGKMPQGVNRESGRGWPADTQVWGWAESVVLAGYGPGPGSLL
ncbi:hypothetical protein DI272_14755 [Streptomyces sp. Act143]|nr:hypothetical protein DI272_14755 [Streptomyces sp. Act143]